MERIETPRGITYSYEKSGSGPPLVIVHGSLSNHQSAWMMVKPLLEPNFTVYAVARRGRGETSATEGHTIPEEAHDLAALIEKIGEPVFLLGHSFGAQVSLAAAALVPNKIRKLILYEPPVPSARVREQVPHLMGVLEKEGAEVMVDQFLRNTIQVPGDQVDVIKTTPFWQFLVGDAQNSVREWPALVSYDFKAEHFNSLPMPVLLLTGSDSPPDIYGTNELAAAIPNARVGTFAGQGHVAQILAPQEFVQTVTSFLQPSS
jgi:pimeloyl-ACP methyl ester carboxylesterase